MTDRDNITLPREVVQDALDALEYAERNHGGDDCYAESAAALRTALAAPRLAVTIDPRLTAEEAAAISAAIDARKKERSEDNTHPGYVIGSHWLETAYSRICAGEAEADVLRDMGWERVADKNERLREALEKSLTDEQIRQIAASIDRSMPIEQAKILFARRIEAALRREEA